MDKGVDISGWPSIRALDLADINRSWSLDSQWEVDEAARLVYLSENPVDQYNVQKYLVPKIVEKGFSIPSPFKESFLELALLNENKVSEACLEETTAVGWVLLPVPYSVDLAEIVQRYAPHWRFQKVSWQTEMLLDERGEAILQLWYESPDGKVEAIYSPLLTSELRKTLLWLPRRYQNDFSYLLGLSDPTPADVREYVRKRVDRELQNSVEKQVDGKDKELDSLCHLPRKEMRWKKPNTIREAVMSQCARDPEKILFPEFGVANKHSPFLASKHQLSCISLLIYDRNTTQSLIAHLPTTEDERQYSWYVPNDLMCVYDSAAEKSEKAYVGLEKHLPQLLGSRFNRDSFGFIPYCSHDTFPFEWYVSTFRDEYFNKSSQADLEVTILSTNNTPTFAINDLLDSARFYFPEARIQHLDVGVQSMNYQFDSRFAELALTETFCAERMGCGEIRKKPTFSLKVVQGHDKKPAIVVR